MSESPASVITLNMAVNIAAPPADVWRALTADINHWWPQSFFTGGEESSRQLVFEATPGGRMYEQWDADSGLLWAQVVAVQPNRLLQVLGHSFPNWGGPSTWYGTWEFAGDDRGTKLSFSESVVGRVPDGYVDDKTKGWNFLWDCLRAHLEGSEPPVWAD